jgi:hypothetical protein
MRALNRASLEFTGSKDAVEGDRRAVGNGVLRRNRGLRGMAAGGEGDEKEKS